MNNSSRALNRCPGLLVLTTTCLLSFHGAAFSQLISGAPVHRYSFSNPVTDDAFDAVIEDSIGGAHGMVLGEGASLTGTGLMLPGGSSESAAYVDLPNGLISDKVDATFEAWVTITGIQPWARIFDFGSNSPGGENGELLGPGDDNGGNTEGLDYIILAAFNGTNVDLGNVGYRNIDPVDMGGFGLDFVDERILPSDRHYAVVFDSMGPAIRTYADGELVLEFDAGINLADINDVNNWLGRSATVSSTNPILLPPCRTASI